MQNLIITFVTVYELGTFSKAAEVLYISQPTVSTQIKKLEALLKTKLFIRHDKKGISPTDFGDFFYKKSLELMKHWQETLNELEEKKSNKQRFTLLLSHSVSEVYFIHFIPKLIQTFPQYDFDFLVANSEEIITEVIKEQNTIGIIEKPSLRNDIYEKHLKKDQLVHIGDPKSMYWIYREQNSGMRFYQEEFLKRENLSLRKITTNNLSFLLKLVGNQIGQTIVSKEALKFLPNIQWKEINSVRNLTIIHKTTPLPKSSTADIINFLITEIH